MQHLSNEALVRYLWSASSVDERLGIEWHLQYCPACRDEFCVRDLLNIARRSPRLMLVKARSALRN